MSEVDGAELEQAKSGFDLGAALKNRPQRTKSIELFTDEVTGAQHIDNENILAGYKMIIAESEAPGLVLSDGLRARLLDLKVRNVKLAKEQPKLTEALHKTSLVFDLRAVPRIVKEAATRAAYKATGTSPGNIPAEKITPFNQAHAAYVIAHMVTGYTDNESGEKVSHLTVSDAQNLREFLPEWEYARLEAAVADLNDRNVISEAVTASADF